MALLSPLCQLNGGCMGCCGHDFGTKEQLQKAIAENTKEFQKTNPQAEQQFLAFRDRAHPRDLRLGLCKNLIQRGLENKRGESVHLYCPLHPARHDGRDLRLGHCDADHLCRTAKYFATWSKQKQDAFTAFLSSKKWDSISYSLGMDDSSFLKEFLAREGQLHC